MYDELVQLGLVSCSPHYPERITEVNLPIFFLRCIGLPKLSLAAVIMPGWLLAGELTGNFWENQTDRDRPMAKSYRPTKQKS
jgi:hypothetical protein